MSNSKYDVLKLENQLCFPLYAAAREVVKRYRPYLDELDITYTQYITMMVMWEEKEITVIPAKVAGCTNLTAEEGMQLYKILYNILLKEGEE